MIAKLTYITCLTFGGCNEAMGELNTNVHITGGPHLVDCPFGTMIIMGYKQLRTMISDDCGKWSVMFVMFCWDIFGEYMGILNMKRVESTDANPRCCVEHEPTWSSMNLWVSAWTRFAGPVGTGLVQQCPELSGEWWVDGLRLEGMIVWCGMVQRYMIANEATIYLLMFRVVNWGDYQMLIVTPRRCRTLK